MSLLLCKRCHQHHLNNTSCPNCSVEQPRSKGLALSLFLGLGIIGCNDKSADTADTAETEDTAEIAPEPSSEEDYGVPESVNTGELWIDDE